MSAACSGIVKRAVRATWMPGLQRMVDLGISVGKDGVGQGRLQTVGQIWTPRHFWMDHDIFLFTSYNHYCCFIMMFSRAYPWLYFDPRTLDLDKKSLTTPGVGAAPVWGRRVQEKNGREDVCVSFVPLLHSERRAKYSSHLIPRATPGKSMGWQQGSKSMQNMALQ